MNMREREKKGFFSSSYLINTYRQSHPISLKHKRSLALTKTKRNSLQLLNPIHGHAYVVELMHYARNF